MSKAEADIFLNSNTRKSNILRGFHEVDFSELCKRCKCSNIQIIIKIEMR